MQRAHKTVRALVGSVVSLTLAGLVAAGCNDSSSDFFSDGGDVGLAAHSPVVVANSAAQMALQASLAIMDPANFAAVQGTRPSVNPSGTSTNGSVTLDFGSSQTSGTTINDAVLRGQIQATFVRNANSATVTVTFTTLVATTESLGTVLVDGNMTYACTLNGGTVTGTISGSVDTDASSDFSTFSPSSMSFTLSSSGSNVISGSGSVDSSARGDWTVTYTNVAYAVDPPLSRVVSSGTAVVTRNTGSALSVSLLFTGPNVGTLTVSPGGSTRSFDL